MNFKSYLNEVNTAQLTINEGDMTFDDFEKSVSSSFKKHFPNGYINIQKRQSLGNDGDHIVGYIGMIGDIKDNTGGYHENDKMNHSFFMYPTREPGVFSFKGSGKIYINPAEGSYNAMDSIKTKMGNNSKITLEKADKKLNKFFTKLSGLMKDNIDNIYGIKDIDKKYLIVK